MTTNIERELSAFAANDKTDINAKMAIDMHAEVSNAIQNEQNRKLKDEIRKEKNKEKSRMKYAEQRFTEILKNGTPAKNAEAHAQRAKYAEDRIATLEAIEEQNTPELLRRSNQIIKDELSKVEVEPSILNKGLPDLEEPCVLTPEAPTRELATRVHDYEIERVELVPETQKQKSYNKLDLAAMRSTTRPEITKLLSSLNVNLDMQLTKSDTQNLLACILTCNETQLDALYKNTKIPIAIKTIIKRIKEDAKVGDIATIERLWDRIFGKSMAIDNSQSTAQQQGLIPNTPISREAYVMIRDTFIK